MSKTLVLRPRVSEKAYALSQTENTYVFEVPGNVNKLQVSDAVAAQFKVKVVDVRIANIDGKVKRSVRRRGRQAIGKDVDVKKAFVRLAEGDSIAIFPTEESDKSKSDKKEKK